MASRITTFIIVLIVAGTLVAGLIVGAQRDEENGPVDLIITNGRVYTARDGAFAEAVAHRQALRVVDQRLEHHVDAHEVGRHHDTSGRDWPVRRRYASW